MRKRSEIEALAFKSIKELKSKVSHEFKKFLRRIRNNSRRFFELRYRRLVVLSGGTPEAQGFHAAMLAYQFALELSKLAPKSEIKTLYIYHDEFEDARIRKETFRQFMKHSPKKLENLKREIDVFEKSERYLGTSYDIVILDLNNDLRPNDIGRLVEITKGGGIVVFLTPTFDDWDKHMTIFKQKLLVPGYREPRHIFIKWFKDTLIDADGIYIYDLNKNELVKTSQIPKINTKKIEVINSTEETQKTNVFEQSLYDLAVTKDQLNAIRLMEKLLERTQKKRVLVITSDRGRGKSSALGIGLMGIALKLSKIKHKVRIIITAPEASNVQSLFNLAITSAKTLGINITKIIKNGNIVELQGSNFSIEYWEPIHIPRIRADIVAVDEASSIHVPLLLSILKAHKKIIFTATIHGYEGAGRGFSVRFLSHLKESEDVELFTYEMHTPIRYNEGDPIEKWLYRALLLDAEPADLNEEDLNDIKIGNFEYVTLNPYELFTKENEQVLRQLFGIYVLAHYRNQPDDLAMLADAPHHMIRAVLTRTNKKVVCSLQIALEGRLDEETTIYLLKGNKIPGNIIPDRIIKHVRILDMGRLSGIRIVRIATHPAVQSMGIGSFALKQLYEEAKAGGYDWVGSGFGVNYKLLKFWVSNGFVPVHMSPDRNPVSGEYTVIVLKPISEIAAKIKMEGELYLRRKLVKGLRDTYRDLEHDVALLILKSITRESADPPKLNEIDIDRAWIYVYGPMTYEAVTDIMWDLAAYYFLADMGSKVELNDFEMTVLLAKVLQGMDWESLSKMYKKRQIDLMFLLKDITKKLIYYYYGKDLNSAVGIKIDFHHNT